MTMIQISKVSGDSSAYILKGHNITLSENSLTLELIADIGNITYEIREDMRHRDISEVNDYLLAELNDVYFGKKMSFDVCEDIVRSYVHIGDRELGEKSQFSGERK